MKRPALFRVSPPVRNDVLRMVGPVILEQLLISSMGIVGIILASNLGSDKVAPIGLVDSLHYLFILFFTSIASGATVIVAQHYGRGEAAQANEAARQAMVTSLLISVALVGMLVFTGAPLVELLNGISSGDMAIRKGIQDYLLPSLLSYPALAIITTGCGVLRGTGDTKTPMIITVIMSALNAVLSALLIYGIELNIFGLRLCLPQLGVQGAALALLLSRTIGAAMISYVLIKGQRVIRFSLKSFRFLSTVQRSILSIGIPMTAESVQFQVGKIITGIIVFQCGATHMNANIIAGSIFSLICIPGNSFFVAVMPLVGQSVGRGDFGDAREKMLFVNWLSSLGLLATCAAMLIFSGPLVSLYTKEPAVQAIAADMLKVIGIFMPLFWSASFVLPSGLRGATDIKYTMITSIVGMWVFRVFLGYLLGIGLGLGAVGVYLGMCVDWVVRGILYYIRVRGCRWYRRAALAAAPQVEQQ